jgi:GNAT superfamily N-acetyltransferase
VQSADRELVREFLEQESPDSLEMRYFSAVRPVLAQEEIVRSTPPDDRLCLLALGDPADRVTVLGVGEYARTRPGSTVAEVAFLVATPYRGRGIATLLLARLARAARAFGILRFEARVRSENPDMLEVFRGSGLPLHESVAEGEVDVEIPLCPEVGSSGGMHAVPVGDGATPAAGPMLRHARLSALRSRA